MARLEARLHGARRRLVRATAARAALEALSLQLFLLPLAGILAAAYPFDPLGLQLALATYAFYLWVPLRLAGAHRRGRFDLKAIAASQDRLNPGAPDIFRTVLSRHSHSEETWEALDAFYAPWEARLRDLEPRVWTKRRGLWVGAAAAAALILPLAAGPGVFTRMLLPLRAWSAIPAPRLTPVDLPAIVMRGDSLVVVVRADHVSPSRPVYVHRVDETRAHPDGAGETRYVMERDRPGFARHAFGPSASDFSLRFSTPGFATRFYRVQVAEPPRLASLAVVVQPPAYARLPAERLPEMPALLSVLPGSRVTWIARAAAPLTRVSAEYSATRLQVSGGDRDFSFGRRVMHPGELRLRLADARGAEATEGPFRIELKIDAPPEIVLLAPAEDQDLGRALKLPVLFRARDDYGLSRLWLRYAVLRGASPRSGSVEVTRWLNAREGAGGGIWDAAGLRLEAGDAVEVWLEAFDNDAVSGPKSSLSARVKLRLPSPEEARAAVEAGERDAAVSLASALEREKRLRREEARPNKGASAESGPQAIPMAMPEWEVRRVLSDAPRQHLQELKRQLDAEVQAAEKGLQEAKTEDRSKAAQAERSLKALQELRKEVLAQEKRLPPPGIAQAPVERQKQALEALTADQKTLEKKLQEKKAEGAFAENRRQLEESLKRNLQEQKDMKAWLGEQERKAANERQRARQAAQNAGQVEQDMKRALEQIDQAMEKGLENGTLSPDILDKMERIRELLEEVLDEGEKDALQRNGGDERVEAGDLQKAMRDLLDKKEGLRQNLERAIRMLEALRETRALRDAAAEAREMSETQKEVAAGIEKGNTAELAARQQDLNRRMDAVMKGLENLSKNPALKEALKDLDPQKPREARANMQKAADKLRAPSPDRKAAKQGADLASKQLKQMAAEMEKKVAQLDKAANAAEIRAMLEETLDFSAWLEAVNDPRGPAARSWGGEEGVREGAVRLARWLRTRLEKLADADPFDGDGLRREAAALGFTADALAAAASGSAVRGGLEDLRAHALKAARELFKMLDKDEEGNGDEEGDGAGDSNAGGGEQGESGQEGISGRVKGAAGKQGAVNRATQELLRSFLEGRQGSPQGSGQGPGGQSPGGSQPRPGAGGLSGNSSGTAQGNEPGGEGEGQAEGGQSEGGKSEGGKSGSANGLANAQQQVGESLEQLAEAAGDAGGAARKLRQLAEEARELEEALRRRSLSPAEIQRRQERFQTRLLEAAHALEERGQERERRAEAYKGGALPFSEAAGASFDENWVREVKRRRDEARKLPLPPEQKRRVEWYYERLLAP